MNTNLHTDSVLWRATGLGCNQKDASGIDRGTTPQFLGLPHPDLPEPSDKGPDQTALPVRTKQACMGALPGPILGGRRGFIRVWTVKAGLARGAYGLHNLHLPVKERLA